MSKVNFCFQALEVAGQVAGTPVSTSPLPYRAMASQCEALGTDTRKKLSNWLTYDGPYAKADAIIPPNPAGYGISAIRKVSASVNCQVARPALVLWDSIF